MMVLDMIIKILDFSHLESSGKWGEGLKMLSAAALREGVQMELRSGEWLAIPEVKSEILNEGKDNERTVDRLVFSVKRRVKKDSRVLEDGDNPKYSDYGYTKDNEASSTTFINPTPELLAEFRNIGENILYFSPKVPIASTEKSDVLATTGGRLYVKNVLIPGDHGIKYTYHLKDFDIQTRDRDTIKVESMKDAISEILGNTDSSELISEFLSNAVASVNEPNPDEFLEFQTHFLPNDDSADKWIKVFKNKFGDKTCIRSANNLDFDAYHQAQHMGLDMITLPSAVANALIRIEGKNGERIISYEEALNEALSNVISLKEEVLTDKEKQIVSHLYKYNELLNLAGLTQNPIKQINVYEYPMEYKGIAAAGFASKGNTININRETINAGILEAGDVFFHEATHAVTGAKDAEKGFRDYLTGLLSCIAASALPLQESLDDNGFAHDISTSDVRKGIAKLVERIKGISKETKKAEIANEEDLSDDIAEEKIAEIRNETINPKHNDSVER